jgi:ubiquinone biosynthesis monooxygenase Coq7
MSRDYSAADRFLMGLHRRVAAVARPSAPAENLDERERRHAAGLMRVNHAGEVAAQALYQGQAYTARDPQVREHLLKAAREEEKHLQWCEERLTELGDTPSVLKPLWYAGSFAIGAAAGMAGDKWSLGFVAETEKQVSEHLEEHLHQLPEQDLKSREIVAKMHEDESRHGREAIEAGGRELPRPLRALMKQIARVMKFGAYRF